MTADFHSNDPQEHGSDPALLSYAARPHVAKPSWLPFRGDRGLTLAFLFFAVNVGILIWAVLTPSLLPAPQVPPAESIPFVNVVNDLMNETQRLSDIYHHARYPTTQTAPSE